MSLPSLASNCVATHVYPITDLGMDVSLTSAETSTSTVFHTGIPATVLLISKLTSGSATITLDKASTAAGITHGAPDNTLAASGTGYQLSVMDTSTTEMFVGLKITPGGSGSTSDKLALVVLYEREAGEDWCVGLDSAINCMADTTIASGDGDGLVDLSATKPALAI